MALGRSVQTEEEEERSRPVLRLFLGFLLVATIAVGGGAVVSVLWLRHAMREQLPQLDGQLRLPGLQASVDVRRDTHGVPHIEAANMDDLLEAQGFVTAQDRLWQMDMARRMAAGDAAEVLGRKFIDHDLMQRMLAMRPTAERLVSTLSDRDRRYLEDYARGVNACMDQYALPAEFRLLMYKPEPWRPVDSLLVVLSMAQMLDQHWPQKLDREQVTARIGPTLAADLYPTGSWRDHPPTALAPDLTAPNQVIPQIPLDPSQAERKDLLHLRSLTRDTSCEGCIAGSNEWAVSGAHTASGNPMLSNDMHLEHQIPDIWYETGLEAGSFHAAGVTVPGIPFIVAGHNDHLAWGLTALGGDTQDIYVEKTNGQGQYLGLDGWHPFEHDRETIHVRGGSDITIDVERTDHGPVISPLLPHEKRVLSLKWSIYDPRATGFPLFDLDNASDWTDFRAALRQWCAPTLNFVYADDQGHIGYQAAGFFPERPAGLQGIPIADTQHEWQGFIPFDQLPTTLDPANGILATANARITPDGYQYPLTLEWADPYRNERIWKWLAGKDKLTSQDMLTLQTDVYSEVDQELAQRFAYAIDHASRASARLEQAANLMRTWNGVVGVDSSAAAIVDGAKAAFWPLVLKPRLGNDWQLYHWDESGFAREKLIMNPSAAWLPKKYANWDDLLTAAVAQGIEHAPHDLSKWRYGYAHPVDIQHPLYGLLPYYKNWTGTGVQPQSGDTSTVKQVGRTFGPSQRFTIDWSDPDQATENIVMGESGDPLSPYYRDQWPFWYKGKTFALPFSSAAVGAAAKHTLRLLP